MKKNNKRLWFKITENRVEISETHLVVIHASDFAIWQTTMYQRLTDTTLQKQQFSPPKKPRKPPKIVYLGSPFILSWERILTVSARKVDYLAPKNTLSQCPGLHFLLFAQSKSELINVNFNIFRCQDFLPFRSVSASARDSVFLPEKQKSVTLFC